MLAKSNLNAHFESVDQVLDFHEKQRQAWLKFFSTGEIDGKVIRHEVIESWKRSVRHGLRPDAPKTNVKISHQSIKIIKEKNSELIEASEPVMESLRLAAKDTGFILTLADHNGIVLAVFGDEKALSFAKKNNYVEGCCRTEREVGTNAIGLCLYSKKPVQLSGPEHFNASHHAWTCSSAPVTSPEGELIGAITLSGESNRVHKHTLGMVISAANSISDSLKRKHSIKEKRKADQLIQSIFRCISEAIIMVDSKGLILHANHKALHLIGMDIKTLLGQSVSKIFPRNQSLLNAITAGESLNSVEVPIEKNRKRAFLMVKSYVVQDLSGHTGSLLFLTEKKAYLNRVREASGLRAGYCFEDIVGGADSLRRQVELAKTAAASDSRVLITGETGTGKELFAHSIHNASDRKNGPFVAINCAAIPRDLIESEIMGYANGAFTGARQGGQTGKLELADGGTVFLDEISQMPLDVQVKFLRVLQDGTITRLGDTKPIKLDIRVIAATNEDLYEKGVNQGFRQDLYFRLSVIEIQVPSLRDRPGDIERLSTEFLKRNSQKSGRECVQIAPDAMTYLLGYNWPGNIRELENVMEMAELTSHDGAIHAENLPERILKHGQKMISESPSECAPGFLGAITRDPLQMPAEASIHMPFRETESSVENEIESLSIKNAEFKCLQKAMVETNGNIAEVSKILGISRSTVYRRIKEYNLNKVINYN